MSPLCETYIRVDQLNSMEAFYPLHVYVCQACFLVQLEEYVSPQHIYGEYAYFSSYSDSWVEHARQYCQLMINRFDLDAQSKIVEIASNDGYLLQHFVKHGIPVLGIEPATNVAKVAIEKGIPTEVHFFGRDFAHEIVKKHGRQDLLIGNNVLAHVPDINDFVGGMKAVLAPDGVITMEFPHLARLIEFRQFDTIYHEHFSYLSLLTVEKIFAAHELAIFDVEELATHGGSLRIYACHVSSSAKTASERLQALRAWEDNQGMSRLETYLNFEPGVQETKWALLEFLIAAKRAGKTVAGYGAPGKGNTLLNYCGIRTDFIDYTVDRNPYKHWKYTPGTHIPIYPPEKISETRPDYIVILPWNLKDEVMMQLDYIRKWGGRFVVPIPEVCVFGEPDFRTGLGDVESSV
jgi:2-polyprenyl-3-methyl-5-hydroxy-6-metoxy-1,4-benzoquinol methylase